MKTERLRIFLLVMLVALFFLTPLPFSQRQQRTATIAPSHAASLPKLPRAQKFDWNLLSDFYRWLDRLSESAVMYGYWLPSNIPDMIPEVYASGSNFGITSTGSTSYPTTSLGDSNVESATFASGNYAVAVNKFTTTVPYTIKSFALYQPSSNSGVSAHFGLYPDSGGSPSGQTLVSGSDSGAIALSASTGWVTYTYSTPFYLPPGTYWIAFLPNTQMNLNAVTPSPHNGLYGAQAYGPLPSGCPSLGLPWFTSMSMYYITNAIKGYTKGTQVQFTGTTTPSNAVSSFSFYVTNYAAGDKIILALYSDSSGSPGQELWNSNTSGTDPGSTGWAVIQESSGTVDNSWNVGLTSGSYYWLMWQWNSTDAGPSFAGGSSGTGVYLAQSFGTLPGTFSGGTLTAENWSEYSHIPPDRPLATSRLRPRHRPRRWERVPQQHTHSQSPIPQL